MSKWGQLPPSQPPSSYVSYDALFLFCGGDGDDGDDDDGDDDSGDNDDDNLLFVSSSFEDFSFIKYFY